MAQKKHPRIIVMSNELFKMIEEEMDAHEMYKRYAEAMRKVGEKDAAIIFENIAQMEFKHTLWLKKLYQYFGGK